MVSIAHSLELKGIEKGRQKGVKICEMKLAEMAKRMFRKNNPLDEIIEFTGFTKKSIKELQKQRQK
ncbi:Transposase [Rickettsia akari str. Hartford]|uniref:Transposase n=1 Tax=Rickettsia akari (strain Hartford) TaxID=293614 RepID=A8GN43_RICAH|nr:hypothetical protein [Rickettsia akari]ABV74818.1 Transposase [Rickettsia akari str. Hartford]